jgi:hypothetical protein
MQLIFFVPPNEELEIALPKMKVKGYMYPQMKKPVGYTACPQVFSSGGTCTL